MSGRRKEITGWLGYRTFALLRWFRNSFGRAPALAVGSFFGYVTYLTVWSNKKRYQATSENLRRLLKDEPDDIIDSLIKSSCRHFGRFLLENVGFHKVDKDFIEQNTVIVGLDQLEKAHKLGKGVLLATAHFGNFELGNAALAVSGLPIAAVIRTVDHPDLDKIMDETRTAVGSEVIKKERAARDIIKRLRDNYLVAINIDQNAAFNHIFAPMFDELAATFTTPAVMGLRTGAPIFPMFTYNDPNDGKLHIIIYPEIKPPNTGDKDADIRYITTRINKTLEEAIIKNPEQWLWLHRRWKTRPDQSDIEAIDRETKILNDALGAGWDIP